MNTKFLYETVATAINKLRSKGFDKDFSVQENGIVYNGEKIAVDHLKIVALYRYEGNSDPADEAWVYALETDKGVKGILIAGDGIYADTQLQFLKELHLKLIKQKNVSRQMPAGKKEFAIMG